MTDDRFNGFLFSNPRYFDVVYKINPYMESGVDTNKATTQWAESIRKIREYAQHIEIADYETYPVGEKSIKKLPDSVFCANHAVPIPDDGYILSNMKSEERQPEPHYFNEWADSEGYRVRTLQDDVSFEGCGDAKWHPEEDKLWLGYGYRTDEEAVSEISDILSSYEVVGLELTSEYYYHLDVCFEPLSKDCAIIVPNAFSDESMDDIQDSFDRIITVPEKDNKTMGGNCTLVSDDVVVIDKRNKLTIKKLQDNGFQTVKVDTGEFMKSGGSIDCLSVRLP